MNSGYITDFLIFLGAVIVFIPLFYRLKINPLLAFIGAGIIIGPYGLKLVRNIETAENIGDIGLIFLLFSIGTEISLKRLKAMRKYLLGVGPFQVALTTLCASGVAYMILHDIRSAVVLGYTLAMSSTAVALRVVQEKNELAQAYGRAAVGNLLFQDLAVIPIMILVPQLAGSVSSKLLIDVLISLGKTFVAIILIWGAGKLIIRPFSRIVASTKSVEAFSAMVLLIVIGISALTDKLGLSAELGAFVAGMLLAETEYVNQVEADIHPYSGLLLGIFFLYVGMTIKVSFVCSHIGLILALTLGLMLIKGLACYLIGRKIKIPTYGSLLFGAAMCQASEFGFLVFDIAEDNKILDVETQDTLQAVISLSMVLTPIVFAFVRKLFAGHSESDKAPSKVSMTETDSEYKGHVLIVGYGKSGQFMAKILKNYGIKVCAVDADISRVSEGHKDGVDILYGNASRAKILRAAGIDEATCAVVTTYDQTSTCKILATLRFYFSDVKVYVLSMDNTLTSTYMSSGANIVVPKLEEGCIELIVKLLKANGIKEDDVDGIARKIRGGGYTVPSPDPVPENA